MTTVTATHVPGGTVNPDGFQIDVASAPIKPTSAYASNFTSGTDSWSGFGTGVTVTNDTTTNPDSLKIAGPVNSAVYVHGARSVTGLTIGVEYRFRVWMRTNPGYAKLAVRNASEGTEFEETGSMHYQYRWNAELLFTATATSHVVEVFVRTSWADPTMGPAVWIDTVTVDPTTWLGTTITRTDANGADVPVRNPQHVDSVGFPGFTIMDYEAAMVGPVTYHVVDGIGGTADCTASAAATQSNRATNPIHYPMTAGSSPWAGTGATLTTPSSVAIRGTLTTATATDLAQKISSPTPPATDYFTRGEYQPGDAFQVRATGRCSLATVAGANVQMRQVVTGFDGNITTSDTHLNVSTLPVAGDVIIVYVRVQSSTSAITGVAGCGATWTRINGTAWQPTSFSTDWWIGTGANATGVITITSSATRNANVRGWLIGGLTSTTTNITQQKSASVTTYAGTAINAQSGQIVLQAAAFGGSSGFTYPNPHAPTTGWTTGTLNTDALRGSFNTGYRIPTELSPTSHNVTTTSSGANNHYIENLSIGVAVTPTTPVPHLKTRLTWYDVSAGTLSAVDSNIVTVSDVLWADMIIDTTVPAAADSLRIDVGIEGTVTRTVGDWFEVQNILAGRPGSFFYGDTASTDSFDYEWAATAHASPSLEISTAPTTALAPSLTLPATALLVNNLSPPEHAPLTMATDYDETTESPAAVHTVLGRSDKLSNPAPMLARTGSLTLWCETYAEAVAVRELLKSPNTAMFRQGSFPGMDLYLIARQVDITPAELTPTQHWFVEIRYDEIPRPQ